MNKIKIYFFSNKAFISPPWATPFPEDEADNYMNHDIEIDLRCQKAILRTDYMSSCTAGEMRALQKMLEYAADICFAELTFNQVKDNPSLVRSSFPDADVYIVEES